MPRDRQHYLYRYTLHYSYQQWRRAVVRPLHLLEALMIQRVSASTFMFTPPMATSLEYPWHDSEKSAIVSLSTMPRLSICQSRRMRLCVVRNRVDHSNLPVWCTVAIRVGGAEVSWGCPVWSPRVMMGRVSLLFHVCVCVWLRQLMIIREIIMLLIIITWLDSIHLWRRWETSSVFWEATKYSIRRVV